MRLLSLTWLATLAFAAQEAPLDEFSFGHKTGQTLSPNSFAIPGFSILGEGYVPQLMSDKVIMTPPFGGNKKGAVWSDNKNTLDSWKADFGFRVAVTDQGSGSLQLWYVANGKDTISTNDIYSASRFDGLVIVIDTTGGKQKIRGFLNDGSVDYRSHNNIDSLAFGHCDYQYRNRGDPSHLVLHASSAGLEVIIDNRSCFLTDNVRLPTDYVFGMTASSNDPPDSFEVFGFHLAPFTAINTMHTQQQMAQQDSWPEPRTPDNTQQPPTFRQQQQSPPPVNMVNPGALTALEKRVNDLYTLLERTTTKLGTELESLNSRLSQPIAASNKDSGSSPTTAQLATLDSRLTDLSRTLQSLEKELKSGDHTKQFARISEQIQTVHSGVLEHVPGKMREYMIAHTPRIGFILYSFMAFQCCCAGAWLWYRWRKSTMPKKYL